MNIDESVPLGRSISLLGSTGSIGESTLDIVRRHEAGRFDVQLLTAQSSVERLILQAKEFKPKRVVIGREDLYSTLKDGLSGLKIDICAGEEALIQAAADPVDMTVAAIVGAVGLKPSYAAIQHSKFLALANKESLVCAGRFMMDALKKTGAQILPIDSEHNAILQSSQGEEKKDIHSVVLTASGGPFYGLTRDEMAQKTAKEAILHPTWTMGPKISVDSATLVNKALEIIEAHYLYDLAPDQIRVLVHRQSLIHAMVEYKDGSILCQLGPSDMRVPISYCLGWPHRLESGVKRLSLSQFGQLTFEEPDFERFPLLKQGWDCLADRETKPLIFNAANEIAVAAYLEGRVGFLDIERIIVHCLERLSYTKPGSIDDILLMNQEVRDFAERYVAEGLNSSYTSAGEFKKMRKK